MPSAAEKRFLCEWVLGGIIVALREIVVNLVDGDAHILQYLPEILSCMLKHHCGMVRIVLLDEYVTIETAHVLDAKGSD